MSRLFKHVVLILPLLVWADAAFAQSAPLIPIDGAEGEAPYSLTIQVLALMTALTLLPAFVLMMSSFTRIIIVLSILRQALGTAQTPPNQVLIGLALFLTLFVMAPVISTSYETGLAPYLDGEMGVEEAFDQGMAPLRAFMLDQTRESELELFLELANETEVTAPEEISTAVLVPAFITSELKTAFQIGFLIFIPFVIIDLVVASVLMSMGMMMLSPMLVSLPFKIMLFVLIDGWSLLIGTLAGSFYL
ncbi:MAG: flagellar type III secretion system pore protein FliP [Pseudomonadota bacterium]